MNDAVTLAQDDGAEVTYRVADHVGVITLNRPEVGNALTGTMMRLLRGIWADVRDNPDVRVAIVTGAGPRHFCTGADLNAVAGRGGMSTGSGPLSHEIFWSPRQNEVWKPVIAAVNGVVAGGGLHFVVDADIVVSTREATYLDTHVNVGLVGGIENVGLARRLPLGTALRMTLMGKEYRLPAERAYQLGLVDELVDAESLLDEAHTMARAIARNSPAAVSLSQQAIWRSLDTTYTQACEYGWALVRTHWRHPDATEGPRAFAERRDPVWTVDRRDGS